MNTIKKAPPHPLPKLQRFLNNLRSIFRCSETMHPAERYSTGLLSNIYHKNCEMMAENIEGTSKQALQHFVSGDSPLDLESLNSQRVQYMLDKAVNEDGALIFDDTGFEKKGNLSFDVARQY